VGGVVLGGGGGGLGGCCQERGAGVLRIAWEGFNLPPRKGQKGSRPKGSEKRTLRKKKGIGRKERKNAENAALSILESQMRLL